MPLRPAKINRGNDGLAPVLRIHGVDRSMESFLALSPRECKQVAVVRTLHETLFFRGRKERGKKSESKELRNRTYYNVDMRALINIRTCRMRMYI